MPPLKRVALAACAAASVCSSAATALSLPAPALEHSGRSLSQASFVITRSQAYGSGVGLPADLTQTEETLAFAVNEGDRAVATVYGYSGPSGFGEGETIAEGRSIAAAFNTLSSGGEYDDTIATAKNDQTGIYSSASSFADATAVTTANALAESEAESVKDAFALGYANSEGGAFGSATTESTASSINLGFSPDPGQAVAFSTSGAIGDTDGADARSISNAESFSAATTDATSRAVSSEGQARADSVSNSNGFAGRGQAAPCGVDCEINAKSEAYAEGAARYAKAYSDSTAYSVDGLARAEGEAKAIGNNNAPAIVAGSSKAANSGRRALQQTPADPFGPTPPRPVPTPCPYGRRSLLQTPPSDFFSAYATAEGTGFGESQRLSDDNSQTQSTLAKATNEGDYAVASVTGLSSPSSFSERGTKAEGESTALAVNLGVPGPLLNTKSAKASARNYQAGIYSDSRATAEAEAVGIAVAETDATSLAEQASFAAAYAQAEGGELYATNAVVADATSNADSSTNVPPGGVVNLDLNQAEASSDATAESDTARALAYSTSETRSFSNTATFASTTAVSKKGAAKAVSDSLSLGDTIYGGAQVSADEEGRIFAFSGSRAEGAEGYATAESVSASRSTLPNREARARAGSQATGLDGTPAEASASSTALNQG